MKWHFLKLYSTQMVDFISCRPFRPVWMFPIYVQATEWSLGYYSQLRCAQYLSARRRPVHIDFSNHNVFDISYWYFLISRNNCIPILGRILCLVWVINRCPTDYLYPMSLMWLHLKPRTTLYHLIRALASGNIFGLLSPLYNRPCFNTFFIFSHLFFSSFSSHFRICCKYGPGINARIWT